MLIFWNTYSDYVFDVYQESFSDMSANCKLGIFKDIPIYVEYVGFSGIVCLNICIISIVSFKVYKYLPPRLCIMCFPAISNAGRSEQIHTSVYSEVGV